MIERYQHSKILELFDRDQRIVTWANVELIWAVAAIRNGMIKDVDITAFMEAVESAEPPTAEEVDEREKQVGHDVVAFLDLWTAKIPKPYASYIHRGLTSSDIVDTSLFAALDGVIGIVQHELNVLAGLLKLEAEGDIPRIGRTHGQFAEPTTLQHRFRVWLNNYDLVYNQLTHASLAVDVIKSPGATGRSWFHSLDTVKEVGNTIGVSQVVFGTQVIPRIRLVTWAGALLQAILLCEDIAMEVRLSSRSEVDEIREGAKRVGSSAMPGKRNPIIAESICGFARMARGYFATIAENATLHNDRDISNSSVERVACEDLAHITATAVCRTHQLVERLVINKHNMKNTIQENRHAALASTYQYLLQTHFEMRSVDASETVAAWMEHDEPEYQVLLEMAAFPDLPTQEQASAFTADLMMYESQMGL